MKIFREDSEFYKKVLVLNKFDIEDTFLEIEDSLLEEIHFVILPAKYENKRNFFLAKLMKNLKVSEREIEIIYI